MNQQICLKRTHFANLIRQEQRQRIKKQIRERMVKSINQELQSRQYLNNQDENQFKAMRLKCNMREKQSVQEFIRIIQSKNLTRVFHYEKNIYFLGDLTAFLLSKDIKSGWAAEMFKKIYNKLDQLIRYEFKMTKRDKAGNITSKKFEDLIILNQCFDGLLALMEKYPCYSQLWITFSHLRNYQLKNYSFDNFSRMFNSRCDNFSSQEITTIVCVLDNYIQDCPQKISEVLAIIEILFNKYQIRPYDTVKLIDILLDMLTQPQLKQKIQILLQTTLIENITSLIDKTTRQMYINSFDVATKVAYFIGKLYSVEDEELCYKIYMKNIMILGYMRSWLPTKPNIRLQSFQSLDSVNLTHNSHRCTMYMIFALTNIAVSGNQMLEAIISTSDMYSWYLQLAVNRYLYFCSILSADVKLTKLPQILVEMLKQTNTVILKKALEVVTIIIKMLEKESCHNQWVYTMKKFRVDLQNCGAIKELESLTLYSEQKISGLAVQALQNLRQ